MAQGILAKQAGGVKTLRGKEGLFLVGKSDPSLATAIPSNVAPDSEGQFHSQFRWAYPGGLAGITLLMRFSIALLLFAAIVLKLDELSIDVSVGRVKGPWLWPVVSLIQWELLLSIWLLSGIAERRALTAAFWTFGVFGVYSLGLLGTGASTCGCFGRWELHPAWTLSLDLTTISALLWRLRCPVPGLMGSATKPSTHTRASPVRHDRLCGILCLVAWLSLSVLFLAVTFGRKSLALDRPGMTDLGNGVLLLEPEKWNGHRLPILASMDIHRELAQGEWTVVLLRQSCPHCTAELDTLRNGESQISQGRHSQGLAFIDLDATLTAEDPAIATFGASHIGHVDAPLRKALVTVPVIFDMTNGVVTNAQLLQRRGSIDTQRNNEWTERENAYGKSRTSGKHFGRRSAEVGDVHRSTSFKMEISRRCPGTRADSVVTHARYGSPIY